jgi:phage-related protein
VPFKAGLTVSDWLLEIKISSGGLTAQTNKNQAQMKDLQQIKLNIPADKINMDSAQAGCVNVCS